MKKILGLLFTICIICSCKSNSRPPTNSESASLPEDSLVQKYENEFFSIMYPQNWTSVWTDNNPDDERIKFIIDSLGIKGGTLELWSPDYRTGVKLVKSISAWLNPNGNPKQWCEMSALARQIEDNCIGMSEITDSIIIEGYPAAEIAFAYYNGQDTTIQSQYAIIPKTSELYYANIMHIKGDEEGYRIGWKMLQTLHFKVDIER